MEEGLTRQVPALLDDARHPPVLDFDGVILAALAPELEPELGAFDVDVAVAQRRALSSGST